MSASALEQRSATFVHGEVATLIFDSTLHYIKCNDPFLCVFYSPKTDYRSQHKSSRPSNSGTMHMLQPMNVNVHVTDKKDTNET